MTALPWPSASSVCVFTQWSLSPAVHAVRFFRMGVRSLQSLVCYISRVVIMADEDSAIKELELQIKNPESIAETADADGRPEIANSWRRKECLLREEKLIKLQEKEQLTPRAPEISNAATIEGDCYMLSLFAPWIERQTLPISAMKKCCR
ncbi:hypothetical protein WJX74_009541 [Apatococcus lobatus]|uniref:Uncharacterized protein n=1 Tax=Apatococcus lobatus TaxID=904363 RepID=A0AAW1Q9A0_9CHLO